MIQQFQQMERSAMAVVIFACGYKRYLDSRVVSNWARKCDLFQNHIFMEVIRFLCFYNLFRSRNYNTTFVTIRKSVVLSNNVDGVQSILSFLLQTNMKMIRSPNVVEKSDGDEVFHVITLFIFLIFMNLY